MTTNIHSTHSIREIFFRTFARYLLAGRRGTPHFLSMPAKIIILAGAPAPSTVNLSSCVDDIGKASRCFDAEGEFERRDSRPAWRSLSLIRKPLHTGFSLVHDVHDTPFQGSATFFTTADVCVEGSRLPPGSDADAVMAQFFEQTLAEHGTDSSPPPEDSFATDDATSMLTASSADITHTYTDSMPPPPAPPALSDLKDVPAASRIAALQPQTLTLNLIVGVISIAQPRTVTTRWGKPLSLVEVLVGDNTATGFAITFWLSSEDADSSVLKLRRQDVVLVEKGNDARQPPVATGRERALLDEEPRQQEDGGRGASTAGEGAPRQGLGPLLRRKGFGRDDEEELAQIVEQTSRRHAVDASVRTAVKQSDKPSRRLLSLSW
ncbi:hypothetical protein DCS_06934 [Drechmeria coniospora]|uniref:Nucleic acid-binding, OB-fold protein n=1 Tax=Drechmeria coniospora TaxID=98403 RepID=A0A151GD39_DRECN|nr:hypothetical protein DCS_06934 [Drechmeria coniospora]KYK54973.1 hypothetical protein DCS_06934 [Drechmeria coniospora]